MRSRLAAICGITISFVLTLAPHAQAQDGTWVENAPLLTGRAGVQAEAVDGIVYAIGGVNGGAGALATEAFDPAGNWAPRAVLQPPPGSGGQRSAFATAVVDGQIYAFGGGNGSIFFDDVQAYDPTTDSWSVRNPMPTSRAYAVAAAMNGKIYLIGGHVTPGGPNAPTLEYDPMSDTWTEKAAMLTHRINPGVAVLNGKFYVVGGATTGAGVSTVEVYDPVADEWSIAHDLSTPRMNPAVRAVGGLIYAFGGVNDFWAIVDSGEVYDPALNVWSDAPALPAERTVAGSAVLDGVFYLIGGQSGTFPFYHPEVFAFTPTSLGFMDTDGDGVGDDADNCPAYTNADQTDADGDGLGDPCDAPAVPVDTDGDGVEDATDNCPLDANVDQADTNGDGEGDACDTDDDGDGVVDESDAFPLNIFEWADTDNDGLGDNSDGDDDNDAIADGIDTLPLIFSDDYRLDATFGHVLRNEFWTVSLMAAPPPPPGETGWGIRGSASGTGAVDSSVSACSGNRKEIKLGNGETADWRCAGTTLTLRAVTGSAEVWEQINSVWVGTTVPQGSEVSIGSPVTAGAGNGTTKIGVSLLDDGLHMFGSFELDAGESVDVQLVPGPGDEDLLQLEVLHGEVTVTVFGRTTILSEGGDPTTFSLDPPPTIAQLIQEVQALALPSGLKRSLLAKLTAAERAIARGQTAPARGTLGAFVNEVAASKRRGDLPAAVADALIAGAQAIAAGL